MSKAEVPIITVNSDKKCKGCGAKFPTQCGYCISCVAEHILRPEGSVKNCLPTRKETEVANCPIIEQMGDGTTVGRCWFHLPDGKTCSRHGDVSVEVRIFQRYGHTTLENIMRRRKGLPRLGKAIDAKGSDDEERH